MTELTPKQLGIIKKHYDTLVSNLYGDYRFSEGFILDHKEDFAIKAGSLDLSKKHKKIFYYKGEPLFILSSEVREVEGVQQFVVNVERPKEGIEEIRYFNI